MSVFTPSYYKPADQLGKVYRPDTALAIAEGMKAGWSPARNDAKRGKRVALLIVDMQNDFVNSDGALSVPGAVEDEGRLNELVYREGKRISTIVPTIDTHFPFMIFFPTWWRNKNGQPPTPYTVITEDDIRKGVWQAVVEPAWSHRYVSELTKTGKYALMIWPFHTMDGTEGINLVPALYEALMFHAAARTSQPIFVHKGHIPQTEFYSPLLPEVDVPGVPGGTINTPILNVLASHNEIWIAGEAKSHCVLCAMRTLTDYFAQSQPEVLHRIFFLTDCTSSVKHPQIDFESLAQTELEEMAKKFGVNLVKSTDLYQ